MYYQRQSESNSCPTQISAHSIGLTVTTFGHSTSGNTSWMWQNVKSSCPSQQLMQLSTWAECQFQYKPAQGKGKTCGAGSFGMKSNSCDNRHARLINLDVHEVSKLQIVVDMRSALVSSKLSYTMQIVWFEELCLYACCL